MKLPQSILPGLISIVAIMVMGGCSLDDDSNQPANATVAELLSESTNLQQFYTALQRAELVTTLEGQGRFTVLAPNDVAFNTFLATAGFASIEDIPMETLKQLLRNHIIGTQIDAFDFSVLGRNYTETLAAGPQQGTNLAIYFNATGGSIEFNGVSEVVNANIGGSNGVIHVVDTFIDLPHIMTFINTDTNFELLKEGLTTATPGTNFNAQLSGTGPFTVFAPSDKAFEELLDSNPAWNDLGDIEEGQLTAILQHHLVNGNLRTSAIKNNDTAETLEGDFITFSTADGGVDITDGLGNSGIPLVIGNIQANNGVIHLVGSVLQPDQMN